VNKIGLVKAEPLAPGEQYARGTLQQLFGTSGDTTAETQALVYHYAPLAKKIQAIPSSVSPPVDFTRYQDWRGKGFTFNVDPPGCRDIDDIITIEPQSDGTTFFGITIANLIDLVPPDSLADTYAQTQASTLYDDGTAIAPMLPRWLSENEASFLPQTVRRGMALCSTWDGKELHNFHFQEVLVENNKSFTYENISEHPASKVLQEIASSLKGEATTDSHEWIEQCMVLYNKQVAKLFLQHATGLLRSLKALSPYRLEQKAAEYVLPTVEATHAAFAHAHYTHATSPIRRYADLLAQRYLYAILSNKPIQPADSTLLNNLNTQMKQASRFERDVFFMKKLSEQPAGNVSGTVLGWAPRKTGGWKVFVDVPVWNHILSLRVKGSPMEEKFQYESKDEKEQFLLQKDMCIKIQYFADLTQPNWKQRLVCALKNPTKEEE
jgi:exoribonuclease R